MILGKNIVKVLLENYGYDVIDLGKDVPPEAIVEKTLERDVKLVGLSALMTTTLGSMAETIRQLREKHRGAASLLRCRYDQRVCGRIGCGCLCGKRRCGRKLCQCPFSQKVE